MARILTGWCFRWEEAMGKAPSEKTQEAIFSGRPGDTGLT